MMTCSHNGALMQARAPLREVAPLCHERWRYAAQAGTFESRSRLQRLYRSISTAGLPNSGRSAIHFGEGMSVVFAYQCFATREV